MTRNYPCSDHRLLFMTQHIGHLLTQFPELKAASRVNRTAVDAIATAACDLNPSLNTWAPGATASYASPDDEQAAVNRMNQLWLLVDRVRKAGLEVLDNGPGALFARLWCELDNPGEYVLEASDTSEADHVQYVVFADVRHQIAPDAFQASLARLHQLPELRLAALYFNDLADEEVARLGLHGLATLRGLDLSANQLTQISFRSASLELLNLAGNPITRPPDLAGLPNLKWLGLERTGLDERAIAELRESHPAVTIWG